MRRTTTLIMMSLLVVSMLVLATGCAGSNPLMGSWHLVEVQGRDVSDEGVVKVLAEDHFAFGRPDSRSGVFAGGGTYDLDGATYRETVAYHSIGKLVGRTLEFDCRVEDGLWHHKGHFHVGDEWFDIDEVWERIGDGSAQPRP